MELGEFFDDYSDDYEDDNANEWHEVHNNEAISTNLTGAILEITKYFDDWIRTINVCSVKLKSDFQALINVKEEYFLTFNHTHTLEMLYKVEKVCHIHGKQGGKLYFGHGENQLNFGRRYQLYSRLYPIVLI